MTATSWITEPLGWRDSGNPNTSDANDIGSIRLGTAFLRALGVPAEKEAPADAGPRLARLVHADLVRHCQGELSPHEDASIDRFEQYAHLRAINDLIAFVPDARKGLVAHERELQLRCSELTDGVKGWPQRRLHRAVSRVSEDVAHLERLTGELGEESVLKVDLAISQPSPPPAFQPSRGEPLGGPLGVPHAANPISEEPDAVVPHVRICGGRGRAISLAYPTSVRRPRCTTSSQARGFPCRVRSPRVRRGEGPGLLPQRGRPVGSDVGAVARSGLGRWSSRSSRPRGRRREPETTWRARTAVLGLVRHVDGGNCAD